MVVADAKDISYQFHAACSRSMSPLEPSLFFSEPTSAASARGALACSRET